MAAVIEVTVVADANDGSLLHPVRTGFYHEEDVGELKCRRHHNKEITRDDGLRMIASSSVLSERLAALMQADGIGRAAKFASAL